MKLGPGLVLFNKLKLVHFMYCFKSDVLHAESL